MHTCRETLLHDKSLSFSFYNHKPMFIQAQTLDRSFQVAGERKCNKLKVQWKRSKTIFQNDIPASVPWETKSVIKEKVLPRGGEPHFKVGTLSIEIFKKKVSFHKLARKCYLFVFCVPLSYGTVLPLFT